MRGAISFARFMELALYHPQFGYYRSPRDPFGKLGDFYTAEQLQPVFGDLMASFIAKLDEQSGYSDAFEVLELGAGRAELATSLKAWNYQAFDCHRPQLPASMRGVIIANEFFDALPVDLLRKSRSGWREVQVVVRGDRLAFELSSAEIAADLQQYAEEYGGAIPDGGTLEVSRSSVEWIKRAAGILGCGFFVVFDYGYSPEELLRFPDGTLLCYRRHTSSPDVLESPGAKDISSHVNFHAVKCGAIGNGFELVSEQSLARWALSVWTSSEMEKRWPAADARWRLQWKQLVYGMGETFRVLVFRKRP